MSPIKDIRRHYEKGRPHGYPLVLRWPCAPEGVEGARSSGLICATVVARAMWTRINPQFWPEPTEKEDAITTYMFADFREGPPGLEEALREVWDKAKEAALTQGAEADDSFAGVCRGPGFVKAFWTNPLFQLTTAHYRAGWAFDKRHIILGGEDLARQAVVTWDGVEPDTLAEVVNSLTFNTLDDQDLLTFAFFGSPMLIQVDITPGDGSEKSLQDIQTFSANRWAFVPDPYWRGDGRWKVTGQICYTIVAAVLHRDEQDGADSVRLFREHGREELPEVTHETDWPFDLDDPIPVGSKVTVFYNSISSDGEIHPLRPSEKLPAIPLELFREIKAPFSASPEEQGVATAEDTEPEQVDRFLSVFPTWGQIRDQSRPTRPGAPSQLAQSQVYPSGGHMPDRS